MSTSTITAKDVAALRSRTGAGMMDCKKALEESAGDMEQAVEYLRRKGVAKADKRAGRAASEGRIVALVSDDHRIGALVEVNSETDFVSRNEAFGALATALAEQVFRHEATDAIVTIAAEGEVTAQPWHHDESKTVADAVKEASARTGENIVFRRYARFKTDGVIGTYVHHNGKVAVMVDISGGSGDAVLQAARSIAEHVAAGVPTIPLAVSREEIPADVVERERRIYEATAREQGKAENIIPKVVTGQVERFYKEKTLLDQPWVRDDARTIRQLVDEAAAQAGVTLSVRRFVRFQMGEE